MGRFIEPTIICNFCGKEHDNPLYSDLITEDQRNAYIRNVGNIQDIMPKVDLTTRETLISGLCAECQKSFFGA